jgi:transcription antitermination factor NusG
MDTTREGYTVVKEKDKELETKWYAVYTRPRFEKQVLKGLIDQGIEGYLPLIKTMRQWSDRKKMVEVPLFSSYVFVHIDRSFYDQVLQTHGVVKYITFEGKAATIPSDQIDNLKIIVDSNEKVETTWEIRRKGDNVIVTAGSLKGLKGELITEGDRKKVMVRIEGIDQNLTVEVHSSLIETIRES